mmetsp:Transcript_54871/g.117753  ORF Transcript_54871/g.117753 Transcript_54871/m.117753 type:complete len:632 (-) Transcript_54871:42-1937(-)|eukprot:CAMPEP_0180703244 /NCGR_PEP_ID=MMETSP1038_2-20121128/6533_1 /TAXON_ID=632150 /ORGANISM="Azadinium spinosum, Strain 3D9" /LENGTH=631 /DNA_ID=CAMNT_0022735025 /DNA_START=15 /DNA_END=1910 /DNA_ORIENTATION=+
MDAKLEARLATIETKLEERLTALETNLEAKLDRVLACLEPSPGYVSKLRSEVHKERSSFKDCQEADPEKETEEETADPEKETADPEKQLPLYPNVWASDIPIPEVYQSRKSIIQATEFRAISIFQLNELAAFVKRVVESVEIHDQYKQGARVTWDIINLYVICQHFVMPLTEKFKCSFVELVALEEQVPAFFVSHWWGTPFQHTVKLLAFHAKERGFPDSTFYWICTFANNQHNLAELSGGLEDTPFVKAIMHPNCVGTVALMDADATTLKRIWCVLELYESTVETRKHGKQHYYDLAAWLPDLAQTFEDKDVPACATLQIDKGDGTYKEFGGVEGASFPLDVAEKGIAIDIYQANASRVEDKNAILNFIAGNADSDSDAKSDPPHSHEKYDALNYAARERFAGPAMYRAVYRGRLPDVQSLLAAYPSSKNFADAFDTTATFCAAWKGKADILKVLIEAKADCNKADQDGSTPCFTAAENGRAQELRMLLAANADFEKARTTGTTPLAMAAQNGESETMQILIEARADLNARMGDGTSPLGIAAYGGHTDAVKLLIEVRADIDHLDDDKTTPLFIAAENGHHEVAKLLVHARADLKIRCMGKTPLQIAKKNRYPKVATILQEAAEEESDEF